MLSCASYVSKAPFNNLVLSWAQVEKFSMKNDERRQNTSCSSGSKTWFCVLGSLYQQAHPYTNLLFLWHGKNNSNGKVNNKSSTSFLFPLRGLCLFLMTGMAFYRPSLYFWIQIQKDEKECKKKDYTIKHEIISWSLKYYISLYFNRMRKQNQIRQGAPCITYHQDFSSEGSSEQVIEVNSPRGKALGLLEITAGHQVTMYYC